MQTPPILLLQTCFGTGVGDAAPTQPGHLADQFMAIFDGTASEELLAAPKTDHTLPESSETEETVSEVQLHGGESSRNKTNVKIGDLREEGETAGVPLTPGEGLAKHPRQAREGVVIGPETAIHDHPAPHVAPRSSVQETKHLTQEAVPPVRLIATDRGGVSSRPRAVLAPSEPAVDIPTHSIDPRLPARTLPEGVPHTASGVVGPVDATASHSSALVAKPELNAADAARQQRAPLHSADLRFPEIELGMTSEPGGTTLPPRAMLAQDKSQVTYEGQAIAQGATGKPPPEMQAALPQPRNDVEGRADRRPANAPAKSRADVPADVQAAAEPHFPTRTPVSYDDHAAPVKKARSDTIQPPPTLQAAIVLTKSASQATASQVVPLSDLARQSLVRSEMPLEARPVTFVTGSEEVLTPLTQTLTPQLPDAMSQLQLRAPGVGPTHSQVIVRQVLEAFGSTGRDLIEITLDPPELGRIRMAMAETAGSISVTIQADTAATSDLLRRHQDMLRQDLLAQGYKDVSFTFEQNTSGGQRQDSSDTSHAPTGDVPEMQTVSETRLTLLSAGVDIRL